MEFQYVAWLAGAAVAGVFPIATELYAPESVRTGDSPAPASTRR